jgi:hypothetical protein
VFSTFGRHGNPGRMAAGKLFHHEPVDHYELCLSSSWTGVAAHTGNEQTQRLSATVLYDLESRWRRHS